MISQQSTPLGFVTVVVTPSVAVGLTAGIVSGTTTFVVPAGDNIKALFVAAAAVRWRDDGVAPTPTQGMPMQATQAPFEYSGDLAALQFISISGTAAVGAAVYRVAG